MARPRARAESACDDAERRAARLASENAALVSMLERYRGVDPNTAADPDPTNPPASIRDEMRVAVAEGELASCRARLRAAETALDDWRAHAASLSDRLAVAEASAAAANEIKTSAGFTLADVEALARRVDEAERLAAAAVAAAANESPSSIARRRRAEANDARLEQSRKYLERADAAANGAKTALFRRRPSPAKTATVTKSASVTKSATVTKSASARGTYDANVSLAEALAAARRVSETAERRLAAGRRRFARAAALETSASRRLASKPAAVAVVDVRAAVESIERAVAEAE